MASIVEDDKSDDGAAIFYHLFPGRGCCSHRASACSQVSAVHGFGTGTGTGIARMGSIQLPGNFSPGDFQRGVKARNINMSCQMLVLARTAVARAAAAASGGGLSLAAKRSVGSARSVVSTSRQAVAVASLGNGGNQSMHSSASSGLEMHGTTILCVRKNGKVVMMGDGQVSQGDMVVKPNATKVRKLSEGRVLAGYAGSTADALTLMERLEGKLEEHEGQLQNACVSLAKDWRTDKYLRRLEAVVLVADSKTSLKVTGLGDVLAPSGGVIAVGSGQPFALAAARALAGQEELSAEEVARRAMEIASELCVYTNNNFTVHSLDDEPDVKDEE